MTASVLPGMSLAMCAAHIARLIPGSYLYAVLLCYIAMAACRVVYEMFSDINVTVDGPPCVFQ